MKEGSRADHAFHQAANHTRSRGGDAARARVPGIGARSGSLRGRSQSLSRDDQRIRGTWLNYEVSGVEGGTGQWTAERRVAED